MDNEHADEIDDGVQLMHADIRFFCKECNSAHDKAYWVETETHISDKYCGACFIAVLHGGDVPMHDKGAEQ
jgi:hypothetical protein